MSSKKKLYYTTEQLDYFIEVFNKLVKLFGVSDYSISYRIVENTKWAAHIDYDIVARYAVVSINKRKVCMSRTEEVDKSSLRESAAHEFAHLLTADLSQAALSKDFTMTSVDAYTEAVARRFEYASEALIGETND